MLLFLTIKGDDEVRRGVVELQFIGQTLLCLIYCAIKLGGKFNDITTTKRNGLNVIAPMLAECAIFFQIEGKVVAGVNQRIFACSQCPIGSRNRNCAIAIVGLFGLGGIVVGQNVLFAISIEHQSRMFSSVSAIDAFCIIIVIVAAGGETHT